MKIVHDYKNHRISAEAVSADGLWNAKVRITELFTYGQEKPPSYDVLLVARWLWCRFRKGS